MTAYATLITPGERFSDRDVRTIVLLLNRTLGGYEGAWLMRDEVYVFEDAISARIGARSSLQAQKIAEEWEEEMQRPVECRIEEEEA